MRWSSIFSQKANAMTRDVTRYHVLTQAQQRLLDFLYKYARKNEGRSPTYAEIMGEFGWSSTGTVCKHLEKLRKRGCVRVTSGLKRGIQLPSRSTWGEVVFALQEARSDGRLAEAKSPSGLLSALSVFVESLEAKEGGDDG